MMLLQYLLHKVFHVIVKSFVNPGDPQRTRVTMSLRFALFSDHFGSVSGHLEFLRLVERQESRVLYYECGGPLVRCGLCLDVHTIFVVAFLELATVDLYRCQVAGSHTGGEGGNTTGAG